MMQIDPITTLADAHAEWHAVNGALAICPLDCGVNEAAMEEYEQQVKPLVRCGFCKELQTVDEVRECSREHYERAAYAACLSEG